VTGPLSDTWRTRHHVYISTYFLTIPVQLCHTSKAFVSSYYSNLTCFRPTDHHQV
jgi:hypothetical protein